MTVAADRVRADLAIVLVALLWGATFVVVKGALRDASALLFLAIRFSLAFLILILLFRRRFSNPGSRRAVLTGGTVAGLLLFGGYAFQTVGLNYTTASRSAFLTGLYIVLVPLFSSFVKRSVPSAAEWLGTAMAAGGTALITSGSWGSGFNRGDALTVACAIVYAGHILAVAHYARDMNYEVLSVLQIGGVALFSWLTCWWVETPYLTVTKELMVAIGVTAILATAASFALYTWAQGRTTATRAALLFSTEPVFAGLTAWAAAGEQWTARSLAGAGLILAGILSVELKPSRSRWHL